MHAGNYQSTHEELKGFIFELQTNATTSFNASNIKEYLTRVTNMPEVDVLQAKLLATNILVVRAKYLQLLTTYYIYIRDDDRVQKGQSTYDVGTKLDFFNPSHFVMRTMVATMPCSFCIMVHLPERHICIPARSLRSFKISWRNSRAYTRQFLMKSSSLRISQTTRLHCPTMGGMMPIPRYNLSVFALTSSVMYRARLKGWGQVAFILFLALPGCSLANGPAFLPISASLKGSTEETPRG